MVIYAGASNVDFSRMPDRTVSDFPLFPLGLVALPHEYVPLHIFEQRYRTMFEECLERESEFGIVWSGDDDEVKAVGCACEVTEVLERTEDGRMNILTKGTRPFRVLERQDELPYPAGEVEFLVDREEPVDRDARDEAHAVYANLVEQATDRRPEDVELAAMGAYDMAATVDFEAEAKQELLDLRSEGARLRLVARLFRAAAKRLELVERTQELARSNGKVHFG